MELSTQSFENKYKLLSFPMICCHVSLCLYTSTLFLCHIPTLHSLCLHITLGKPVLYALSGILVPVTAITLRKTTTMWIYGAGMPLHGSGMCGHYGQEQTVAAGMVTQQRSQDD